VGTGPFLVQDWVPGDRMTVQHNPAYWQVGKPRLDQIELYVLRDPQASVVTLEGSGVDWLIGVPGQDALRLQADPAYQVLPTGSGGMSIKNLAWNKQGGFAYEDVWLA
jgi:ABC-type transport system substrate-binding protein